MADTRSKALVEKVLGDSSLYPSEFTSFLQRYLSGNALITLTQQQLPSMEPVRLIGAASNPVFLGSVGNYGLGFQEVGFWKTPESMIHLLGAAKWDAVGNVGFALPTSYRPAALEAFAVVTSTGIGQVRVDQDGNVSLASGGTAFVSLSGISYRAA